MAYSYAVDKQVTAETIADGIMEDASYTAAYDPGDRLTSWSRTGLIDSNSRETEAWNYDDAGNWNTNTRNGDTTMRRHNKDNELTKIGNNKVNRDRKGNLTKDHNGIKYRYDRDNRLKRVIDGSRRVDFKYDAFGRRVYRKQGSDKQVYLWWGDQEVSEHESRAGQQTIQNDLWAHPTRLNTIIARAVEGDKRDIQWYHKNYLDHVYAVSDDGGNILEHYRYTAFGEVEIYNPSGDELDETEIANTVLWNSRRYDQTTGLYYYKYRHYSAELGRWPSRDSIEEDGGINLYVFVGNDGINYWDMLGLDAKAKLYKPKFWSGGNVFVATNKFSTTTFFESLEKIKPFEPSTPLVPGSDIQPIVVTKDSGFIDIGHVRHNMDRMLSFYLQLSIILEKKKRISKGGGYRSWTNCEPPIKNGKPLWKYDLPEIMITHDITTYEQLLKAAASMAYREGAFYEAKSKGSLSYYGIEDLYSNKFGIDIALESLKKQKLGYAPTEQEWATGMDKAMIDKIKLLNPLTKEQAIEWYKEQRSSFL